jgi:uncharacterized repeat protein (TIGR03803 family)
VYSVTPPATEGGAWTADVIHTFADAPDDGTSPYAGLTSAEGMLYGTTYDGGAWGKGTVYSLTPPTTAGGPWTEAVLYSFAGAAMGDGSYPEGGVVAGSGGRLYGTTFYGGTGTALREWLRHGLRIDSTCITRWRVGGECDLQLCRWCWRRRQSVGHNDGGQWRALR